jgi:hypothetical protein
MASVPYVPRRPRPTRDPQNGGAVTWERYTDNAENYELDLLDLLTDYPYDKWDTVTAEDVSGVTVSAITLGAGGLLTVRISGGSGTLVARCVTDAGNVVSVPLCWRSPFSDAGDVYA